MKSEVYNFTKKKYPDIFDEYCISFTKVGNILDIVSTFENNNDISSLKMIGLENFRYDIKCIFDNKIPDYIKQERKEKLERLKKLL